MAFYGSRDENFFSLCHVCVGQLIWNKNLEHPTRLSGLLAYQEDGGFNYF